MVEVFMLIQFRYLRAFDFLIVFERRSRLEFLTNCVMKLVFNQFFFKKIGFETSTICLDIPVWYFQPFCSKQCQTSDGQCSHFVRSRFIVKFDNLI